MVTVGQWWRAGRIAAWLCRSRNDAPVDYNRHVPFKSATPAGGDLCLHTTHGLQGPDESVLQTASRSV